MNETHQAAHSEPAAIELEQPVESSTLAIELEADSVADADVVNAAEIASIDALVALDDELVEIEDQPVANPAPINVASTDAPAALDDAPLASVDPADVESSEELVALEAGAVARTEVSEQARAELPNSSAPAAQSPKSSNGTAATLKSGRGPRRQQSPAEPTVKPAAKRRSSGSKRKQTT